MAVTNPPSMSKIVKELGGPGNLRAYVRGGPHVPNIPANSAISTNANTLAISQFVGATGTLPFYVTANDVFKIEISNVPIATSTAFAYNAPGAVTYFWSRVSGYDLLWGSNTSATAEFRSAPYGGYDATYMVTATSGGKTATKVISVYLQRGNVE